MRERVKNKWRDLGPRVTSGIVLAIIGGGALVLGHFVFLLFISICAGLMIWEIYRMGHPLANLRAKAFGVVGGITVFLCVLIPFGAEGVIFALLAAAIFATIKRDRVWLSLYAFGVLAACGSIWMLRELSLPYTLWLVLVVVMSDILGYFVGKSLGGPKFWPAISPKKTWSGTTGGWVGAAAIGWAFSEGSTVAVLVLMFTSVFMAFAGQLGDIAESALKRRAGVKDSSALIPGHGGLLDRFDALMAAALVLAAYVVIMEPFIASKGY
ncbi:phosphatidate cytidylyltransferase [Marivivens aquimaris]|uniref:phosphatidate cytidylyltransferase n=1 Tax=Marivivens aquimaris TaxID=2774876 RepID=UPI0018818D71|nr:phosphatidate cytidylyltransferase [Marivivens aquimaris]